MAQNLATAMDEMTVALNNVSGLSEEGMAEHLPEVKEALIVLNSYLQLAGAREGVNQKEMNIRLRKGEPFPVLFNMMNVNTPEGRQITVVVTELKGMVWSEDGEEVTVYFLGEHVKRELQTIPQWCLEKGIIIQETNGLPKGFDTKDPYLLQRLFTEEEFTNGLKGTNYMLAEDAMKAMEAARREAELKELPKPSKATQKRKETRARAAAKKK